MLRRIHVIDSPEATAGDSGDEVLVALNGAGAAAAAGGRLVVEFSSYRAAALYVRCAGPTEMRLSLREPLRFAALLAELDQAPAVRAA